MFHKNQDRNPFIWSRAVRWTNYCSRRWSARMRPKQSSSNWNKVSKAKWMSVASPVTMWREGRLGLLLLAVKFRMFHNSSSKIRIWAITRRNASRSLPSSLLTLTLPACPWSTFGPPSRPRKKTDSPALSRQAQARTASESRACSSARLWSRGPRLRTTPTSRQTGPAILFPTK